MLESLSPEKIAVIESIYKGKNIFITGSAGTGKSHLLKIIKNQFRTSGIHVTASTGIAAVNIGGVTIHSWSGIGIGTAPASEIIKFILSGKGTFLRRKIRKAKILAIDEISMIPAPIFDLLDEVFKSVRGNPNSFGGIQMIVLGDFLQLPPVTNFENNIKQYCFEAESWSKANFQIFYLQEIFRQEDKDFANLLMRMRIGELNDQDLDILESRLKNDDNSEIKPTIIVTHNKQVDLINQKQLALLTSSEVTYNQKSEGDDKKLAFLKKNCLASEKLVLKIGAQVMMLKNTYYKENIINGSIGVITEFSKSKLPIVKFACGTVREIELDNWVTEELDPETLVMKVKAKITQLPLALAWAVTVHKSQGMTLDKIECDLSSAFEEGQIYVAISRVKSLDGLYLKTFNPRYIKVNPKVINFYNDIALT